MKTILFSLTIAVLLWSLTGTSIVQAKSSGYTGLIAPAPKANTALSAKPETSTYKGLLAPAPNANTALFAESETSTYEGLIAPTPLKKGYIGDRKKQPLGYSGLISGSSKKQQDLPTQMTKIPGNAPQITPRTSDDIKALAQIYGQNRGGNLLPNALRKPKLLSKKTAALLAGPRTRIKGKLPMIYMIEKKIKKLMSRVESKGLSPKARMENAREAYKELAPFAKGLRHKKKVPDDIYRQMGLSEIFIKENKTGTSIALTQLDETLRKLKSYE